MATRSDQGRRLPGAPFQDVRGSGHHAATGHLPLHAQSGLGLELRYGVKRKPLSVGATDDRLAERMLGLLLHRSGEMQERLLRPALRRENLRHLRLPAGDRPGLVQHHEIGAAGDLQSLGLANENPDLRALARAHEERGRGGQSQRAGAGDDEDGDRGRDRVGRVVPEQQPYGKRDQRDADHDGDEDGGDAVREPLDRGLRALRLLHQPDDLREHGLRADTGGLEAKRAGQVHGPAGHRIAGAFFDRQALPGDHAFIHGGSAFEDPPIHREAFPGTDQDEVARAHFLNRNFALPPPAPRARSWPAIVPVGESPPRPGPWRGLRAGGRGE